METKKTDQLKLTKQGSDELSIRQMNDIKGGAELPLTICACPEAKEKIEGYVIPLPNNPGGGNNPPPGGPGGPITPDPVDP